MSPGQGLFISVCTMFGTTGLLLQDFGAPGSAELAVKRWSV